MWATTCKSYEGGGGERGTGWPAGRAHVAGTAETRDEPRLRAEKAGDGSSGARFGPSGFLCFFFFSFTIFYFSFHFPFQFSILNLNSNLVS
jgi:hypothetical protein